MKKFSTLRAAFVLSAAALALSFATPAFAQPCHLVISQVYGGGGNASATYRNDFVEIFNPTGTTQSLSTWSIQYASSAGTSWAVTSLTGSVGAGKYYLIQLASGGAVGAFLPTADATGTTNMSASAGKVALVSSTTALSGACPTGGTIVDFIGFGGANCSETAVSGGGSNTTAMIRAGAGCTDSDDNSADFAVATPTPRNSATAANYCVPTKLVITSISPASPTAGVGFDVTVEAQNANSVAQNVIANTLVTLTTNGNAGAIGGTTSNTIANGTSSIVISGVTLASAGTGVTLTGTRTSGQTCLTAGTSATFTVAAASANTVVQLTSSSSSVGEGVGTTSITASITNPNAGVPTTVDVVLISGSAARVNSYTTQTLTFTGAAPGNQSATITVTDNSACDGNAVIGFQLQNVGGGTSATIGTPDTHDLTITDNDVCTSVQFVSTSSSIGEAAGTTNLALAITNYNPSGATSVTISAADPNGRITSFTTPVDFPTVNSGSNENCLVTLNNDAICNGSEDVILTITGISGGQGTPFIGANNAHTLTVNDDEAPENPVTIAATPVSYYDFDANWNTVTGATGYFLDVSRYANFLDPAATNVVTWDFPAASADVTADSGIPANLAQTISNNAAGTTGFVTGSQGVPDQCISNSNWVGGNGTKWWEVDFSTTGYYNLDVSSAQQSSNTGPRDFKVQYKIGAGGTWTDVPSGTVTVANNFTTGVITNLALPTACDNQASVYLRWIMTSNTSVNAGTVAGAGTSRIDDIVVLGHAPSFFGGFDNFSVGNVLTYPVTGTTPLTTYYYRVRSTGGCSSGLNSNTTPVTTIAVPTYYSRNTGNVTDAIWSDTPTGTQGPAVWSNQSNMVVQNTDVVTNTGTVTAKTLTVEATATLNLDTGSSLKVTSGSNTLGGTFTAADNSTFRVEEGSTASLAITGTASFFDFSSGMTTGTTVTGGMDIRGTLLVFDGDFDASGATVVLRSDINGTGRLGEVGVTASYTGNLKIERYIPAGATNWRLLGSPIAGRKVIHWQDDFITSGYPGSQFPNWPSAANPFPSVRWLDETNTGTTATAGMMAATSDQQLLLQGQGFAVWCGDALGGTAPFVIDLANAAPYVASTPITLPMTYTNTGSALRDGWNMVSNPLPSAIAFDQISRGADVSDQVTFYNPANGNTGVYDISLNGVNPGTNGATNIIQSSQGFFLRATGSNVTTTVSESAKVNSNNGGVFGGTNEDVFGQLRLKVSSTLNTFADEVIVVFHEGTPGYDAADALKYVWAHPEAPQVATRTPNGDDLAIDAHGAFDAALDIPVSVNVAVSGMYTLALTEAGDLPMTCITLEDTETGIFTVMNDGGTYTFDILEDADNTAARFILHASAPIAFTSVDPLCGAIADGTATVNIPNGPADVLWTDDMGTVLLSQTGVSGEAMISDLGSGSYEVHVGTNTACGTLTSAFTINAPFVLEAVGEAMDATCADEADGHIDLLVMGGVAPYTYLWNDNAASATEDLIATAGEYMVTVTDANGCTWTSEAYTIGHGGPVAEISASSTTVLVNTPVQFGNGAATTGLSWDFGDGMMSTESDPSHSWNLPGIYTVTLTVDDGNCATTTSVEITVELNTGIAQQATGVTARAWATPQGIVIEHSYQNDNAVLIEVLDATGRLHMQRRIAAVPGRAVLPSETLSTGIWFVRLTNDGQQTTIRVPLVR